MKWSFYDHVMDLDDAITIDYSEHDMPGIGAMYRADRRFTKATGKELGHTVQYFKEDGVETCKVILFEYNIATGHKNEPMRTIDITDNIKKAMEDTSEEGRRRCLEWEKVIKRIARNIDVLRKELTE